MGHSLNLLTRSFMWWLEPTYPFFLLTGSFTRWRTLADARSHIQSFARWLIRTLVGSLSHEKLRPYDQTARVISGIFIPSRSVFYLPNTFWFHPAVFDSKIGTPLPLVASASDQTQRRRAEQRGLPNCQTVSVWLLRSRDWVRVEYAEAHRE